MITVRNLHKSFNSHKVLDGIDIDVASEETLFFVGESGMGKSVFLEHLIGLQQPDQGSIRINGQEIVGLSEAALMEHRKKIGYVFQTGGLYDFMTLHDNLALPLREHTRYSEQDIRTKVATVLAQVDLEGEGYKFPAELSGGMRKRAAFARAIILGPKILLCDEPTSGLDPVHAAMTNQLIKRCRERFHVTTVVVSHDVASIMQIADRVAFLERGKLIFDGTRAAFCKTTVSAVRTFIRNASTQGTDNGMGQ